jgi:hypothetical protein
MLSAHFLTAYSLLASLFNNKFHIEYSEFFMSSQQNGISGAHGDDKVYLA